jgi:hypothetical protein
MLLDYSEEDVTASKAEADDDVYSAFGLVKVSEKNKFAIDAAVKNDTTGDVEVAANEAISYRAAAAYTLLDYTENAKNPEVSVESGSKYLFDVESYESYAYVRYIDGRLADVVVYRTAEID